MQEKISHFSIKSIERLKESLEISKDKELVEALGIKQNTLSTWKSRNTLDYSVIISFCEERGIDLNYIFLGVRSEGSPASELTDQDRISNLELNYKKLDLIVSKMYIEKEQKKEKA